MGGWYGFISGEGAPGGGREEICRGYTGFGGVCSGKDFGCELCLFDLVVMATT